MGNVGYRFLVSFFGLTLTLILLVNLILFSGFEGFGNLQSQGNVYFGYSSFIASFNLLENMMTKYSFNGFFNMSSFEKANMGLFDALTMGIPNLIVKASQLDYSNIPTEMLGAFPSFVVNDIGEFFNYFGQVFTWIINAMNITFNYFFSWGDVLLQLFKVFLQPINILIYALWILGFVIYWIFIIFLWFISLMRGYITSPMPSNTNSQWSSVVDYWESQWSSLPNGLAISL